MNNFQIELFDFGLTRVSARRVKYNMKQKNAALMSYGLEFETTYRIWNPK